MDDKDKLLSLTQAAKIAGCHPSTLRRAARENLLKAERIGERWAVTRQSLFAWLANEEAHKTGPKPESDA